MESQPETRHKPLLICLNVGAVVTFILTATFNGLAAQPGTGVFISSTTNVSNKYYLEITPAGWTFSIWGLIYLWQALWLIYSVTLLCRSGPDGPLYLNPVILSPVFFLIYIINLVINISWLILFDREILDVAFVFLFFIAFTLYMCLWLSYTALERSKSTLAKSGRKFDDILIRVCVHNGLGIYAAWTTIATFLNMGFVVAYRSDPVIPQNTASSISLGFVAAVLVVFVVTDLTIFDKYSRFTFTPYLVILWALGGSLSKNFDSSKANTIFTLVLIGVGAVALVAKVIVVIVRHKSKPIFSSSTDITLEKGTMS